MPFNHIWKKTAQIHPLPVNTIHLWCQEFSTLAIYHDFFSIFLNREEIERAKKFLYSQDKISYILTRGFLRYLLSYYLDIPAHEICFTYSAHHKPELLFEDYSQKLTFNLSHSNQILLIAISYQKNIGIDVEFMQDDLDFLDIAKSLFIPQEYQNLLNRPPEQCKYNFFRDWTHKEARLKALGVGLSYSSEDLEAMQKLSVKSIPIMENYQAALATSKENLNDLSICYFSWYDQPLKREMLPFYETSTGGFSNDLGNMGVVVK